jgi:hypothetical protein
MLGQSLSVSFAPAEETTLALRDCERVAAKARTDLSESQSDVHLPFISLNTD